jgi:hypothetical protein
MMVEESVSGVPWLYVNAGGTEFLSRCSAGTTRNLVEGWLDKLQQVRALVPEEFLGRMDPPSIFVLYSQDLQQTVSAEIQRELQAAGARGGGVDIAPSMRLADRDLHGSIAYIDEGRLVVRNERNVTTFPEVPGQLTSFAFVGAAGILAAASTGGDGQSFVYFGGRRVELPEPVDAMFGHARRVELLCRSKADPSRFFMVKDDAKAVRLSAQSFTCDEESFYGVGDDGDLLMINVAAGRVARTRLGVALSAVTAARDRLVLADRHGQIFIWK